MEKQFIKEVSQESCGGIKSSQSSFISQTIDELDRIVGLLSNNNDRLDRISSRAGERIYEDSKSSDGDLQKSPESSKEFISELIYIIKSRLSFQEDRLSEIERFI